MGATESIWKKLLQSEAGYRVLDFDVRKEYAIIYGDSCRKALCRTCVGRVLWQTR